jgi:hypothetical protein
VLLQEVRGVRFQHGAVGWDGLGVGADDVYVLKL